MFRVRLYSHCFQHSVTYDLLRGWYLSVLVSLLYRCRIWASGPFPHPGSDGQEVAEPELDLAGVPPSEPGLLGPVGGLQHQEPVWEEESRLGSGLVASAGPWPHTARDFMAGGVFLSSSHLSASLAGAHGMCCNRKTVFGLNDSSWCSFLRNTLFFLVTT